MAVCLGSIANWIRLLTCRQHFHFLSTTLIMGGQFIFETPWPSLKHIQLPVTFSTSKGNLRRHKQMVFDQKQWSCTIDFFKTSYHRITECLKLAGISDNAGPTLLLKQHHLKPLVLLLNITSFMPSPEVCQAKDILTTRHLQLQQYFIHFTFDSRKLSCMQVKDDLPRNVSFYKIRAICQVFSTMIKD